MTQTQITEIATRLAPTIPDTMQGDPVAIANFIDWRFPHSPAAGAVSARELDTIVDHIGILRGWRVPRS